MSKLKIYAKSIIIPLLVGGIIGFITSNSIDYNSLEQPFLAPPGIAFPIVWTLLYTLMGISYGILVDNSLVDSKLILFIIYSYLLMHCGLYFSLH